MVALYGGAVHGLDPFQTGCRVSVVTDHIAHAHKIRHLLFSRILQDGLEGFQIGMYVTE